VRHVVFYGPAEDMARAQEIFPEHQAWYEKFHERGLLLMIGRFTDTDAPAAMSVFTTREAAEEFVGGDPFIRNGVVRDWTTRAWNEVLVPDAGGT
jgi:hypothetical protein